MQKKNGFGLIGHPLGHSFSAGYFQEKFKKEGLDGFFYQNIDTSDPESEIKRLKTDHRYGGFNVTIPYKSLIIPFLDRLSPQAAAIGAVNTIQVENNGDWIGHNTDCIGFFKSLQGLFSPGEMPRKALVLGNGGASQAVQYALYSHHIPYFLVHRHSRPTGLRIFKPEAEWDYADLPPSVMEQCDLVVNTTSLGMFPHTENCPDLPYAAIGIGHKAFDLVYNPEETRFLQRCRAQGAQGKNGLEMLHLQAEAAWRIWQGAESL